MSDDLRTQLHAAAGRPSRPVDPDRIHALRRRWQRRWAAAGTAALVAVVVVAAAVWELPGGTGPVVDNPPRPSLTGTPSPSAEVSSPDASVTPQAAVADDPVPMQSQPWPGHPSQSDAEAARDGVIDEIAELGTGERIGVVDAAVTAEGIWVTSRIPSSDPYPGHAFGDPDGVYGQDFVMAHEYGELLLLDPGSLAISRAWPLPGMPPNGVNGNDRLQVTDRAVYFAHQGDGGLPNSYLMRVDRETFDPVVRIVQYDPGTTSELPYPYWSRAPEPSDVNIQNGMVASDQVVATIGYEGTVVAYDPVTMGATGRSQPDDDVVAGPRGTLLSLAPGATGGYLDPRDLSPAQADLPVPDLAGSVLDIVEGPDQVAMIVASPDGYRVAVWTPDSGQWDIVALPGPGMGQRTARPRLGDVVDQVVVLHDDVIYTLADTPTPAMRPVASLDRDLSDPMAAPGAIVASPDGTGLRLLGQGRYWSVPTPDQLDQDADPACQQDAPAAPAPDTVVVHLGCAHGPDPLRPVTRDRPDGDLADQVQFAVAEFAQGPTADERERGYHNVFPGGPRMLDDASYLQDQRTVVVSLDPAILEVNNLGTAGVTLPFIDGLRATVFQFDEVATLRLEVGGECRVIDPIGECTFHGIP